MRSIGRVIAPLLGAIILGALTAGSAAGIPKAQSRAHLDEITIEVRGDLKSVRIQSEFSRCADASPVAPFDVRSFEVVRVLASSEGRCLDSEAEVQWKIVTAPRSPHDAPETLLVRYQYRQKDGSGRLTCSYNSDLRCRTSDAPLAVFITGK